MYDYDYLDDLLRKQEETEEIELKVFSVEYEDGSSAECGILAVFSVEYEDTGRSQDYCAAVELDENSELPENMEIMLFRYYEDPLEEDSFRLGDIESDEEREIVQNVFEQIMDEEEE